MVNFIEIDFIEAGDRKSGDAITVRHHFNDVDCIYVIDGGYVEDGQKILNHIGKYYDRPDCRINHVLLTHSDIDHVSGLVTVLNEGQVDCLWMNCPWEYVETENLVEYLKSVYPKVAELEKIAIQKGISVQPVFQGQTIGVFRVLSPCINTYRTLVAEFVKKSESIAGSKGYLEVSKSDDICDHENLKGDAEGTSLENEASIIQFAEVGDRKMLLTGDAGVRALTEAYNFAKKLNIDTYSVDWFQVPHHGSRRNLSSDVLDKWLGSRLTESSNSTTRLSAIISANQKDSEHPKKAVVRAFMHRSRKVYQTNGILHFYSDDELRRNGWVPAVPLDYPSDLED